MCTSLVKDYCTVQHDTDTHVGDEEYVEEGEIAGYQEDEPEVPAEVLQPG